VQLYTHDVAASLVRPVRELKGFQKIELEPGASAQVSFEIPVQCLGFHDRDGGYRVEAGEFDLFIGPDSASGLQDTFIVK